MTTNQLEYLKQEYQSLNKSIESFGDELSKQILFILNENNISLGFPIQHRTKTWESIEYKLQTMKFKSILDIQDLCGLRFILLFRRDIGKIKDIISTNFVLVREYDTLDRLDSDQFGYASLHMVIKMPERWFEIPTLKPFKELKAEIQIRTLSQHTWAAASHVLQYKTEENVPKNILRSIYRVSAILEIVDIEFERFLQERENYLIQLGNSSPEQINKSILNVDTIEKILSEYFPPINKDFIEPYSELMDELKVYNIIYPNDLIEVIKRHLKDVLKEDKRLARNTQTETHYFNYAGLLRGILKLEDSTKWEQLRKMWK